MKTIFLIDDEKIMNLSLQNSKLIVVDNQNCLNIRSIDSHYIYALRQGSSAREAGLYLYDARALSEGNKRFEPLMLQRTVIGSTWLEFNFRNERLAVMTDYSEIKLIPLLHRNVMSIVGLPANERFLAFR